MVVKRAISATSLYTTYTISTNSTIASSMVPLKVKLGYKPRTFIYDSDTSSIFVIEDHLPTATGSNVKLDSYAIYAENGVFTVSFFPYEVQFFPVERPTTTFATDILFYSVAPFSRDSVLVVDGVNQTYSIYNSKGEKIVSNKIDEAIEALPTTIVLDDVAYIISEDRTGEIEVIALNPIEGEIDYDPFGFGYKIIHAIDIKPYGFAALSLSEGLRIFYGDVESGKITRTVSPNLPSLSRSYVATGISISEDGLVVIAFQPYYKVNGICKTFVIDDSGNVVMEKDLRVNTFPREQTFGIGIDICFAGIVRDMLVNMIVSTDTGELKRLVAEPLP